MQTSKINKPKLVILVSRFPYPLEKGDKLRAFHQIRNLSSTYEITLIALSEKQIEPADRAKLNNYCAATHIIVRSKWTILWNLVRVLFNGKPFQIGYFYSHKGKKQILEILKQTKPNYIYSQLIRTSEYVKDYHLCSKTIDYMDAFSIGIERRINKASWIAKPLFKMEAKRLQIYERTIFEYFENKTIITKQDREWIRHPNRKEIVCIPNGIDTDYFATREIEKSFDIVFVGNLSYAPNIEAIRFIAKEIIANNPKIRCLISGATPHSSIVKIARNYPQIKLNGWVEDIRTAYLSGKVFVAPMLIGTGLQNKLLEAMSLGIPCITTDLANDALGAQNGVDLLVANTGQEYIELLHKLNTDEKFYAEIGENGRKFVVKNYSWQKASDELSACIQGQKPSANQ